MFDDAVDEGTPEGGEPTQPELSEHARNFLSNVPEEHRPILQDHLRSWDAGFTKYSQEVTGKLKPYQELGDPAELRQAKELYTQFLNDPASVAEFLVTNGYYTPQATQAAPQAGATQAQLPEELQPFINPLQEKVSKIDQIERVVGAIANQLTAAEQKRVQDEEDRQLDNALKALEKQHGKFDVDFVLAHAAKNGGDLEAGVQAFNRLIQDHVNKSAGAPKVLGAKSLPQITKSPDQMTPDERRELLMAKISGLTQ